MIDFRQLYVPMVCIYCERTFNGFDRPPCPDLDDDTLCLDRGQAREALMQAMFPE